MDTINKINVNGVDYLLVPSKETIQQKDINPVIEEETATFNDIDYSNKYIEVDLNQYNVFNTVENIYLQFPNELKNTTILFKLPQNINKENGVYINVSLDKVKQMMYFKNEFYSEMELELNGYCTLIGENINASFTVKYYTNEVYLKVDVDNLGYATISFFESGEL